jgi:hypothetical protein
MQKKAKIIWIGVAIVLILISLASISLFSTNQQVKRMNEKILLFLMSLKDTSWTNPEGRFQTARIVYIDPYSKDRNISFTVPADKIEQFEKGFRESIQNADRPYGGRGGLYMWKMYRLEITTEKKTYKVFIKWTSEKVLFENGMESKDLRKVFFDVGLGEPPTDRDENTNEGPEMIKGPKNKLLVQLP